MSDFSSEIRQRVLDARNSISEAVAQGDEYLAQLMQGELDEMTRLAAEHHVAID